ncbi:uncharacterized protein Dwil_GK27074 [Drosophila willistoni]|uniref:Uncharacterized protein n=1 Tax=Drosophila willistoni TaxID=7260 RepID=A0A0Q9WYM6_DROWI|nr:uncharacterized protein Dwil_GK27269 [Drosophila willistoni]KRG00489.1 uncharacterized protein Dwil_GK27074 [Drosophila willistoni]
MHTTLDKELLFAVVYFQVLVHQASGNLDRTMDEMVQTLRTRQRVQEARLLEAQLSRTGPLARPGRQLNSGQDSGFAGAA